MVRVLVAGLRVLVLDVGEWRLESCIMAGPGASSL